jgi:squalene synthase HpnC
VPNKFASHLEQLGPGSDPHYSLAQARAYCERFALDHEENFPVLSLAVPKGLRSDFAAIYAYCRWADDLGDEIGDPQQSLSLLDWWESEVRETFADRPKHPVMVALRPTIERFAIPIDPFTDLLSAFRQDQQVVRYESMADLLNYCRRSANPVGRLVLYLWGSARAETFLLSDAICTGLQLANFWQDVGVDYRSKGRIYIPLEMLARYGAGEELIAAGLSSPIYRALLEELVLDADRWLWTGLPLARLLPGRSGIMTAMFAEGGRAILRRIQAEKYNTLEHRPRLSRWDKFSVMARGLAYWGRLSAGSALAGAG